MVMVDRRAATPLYHQVKTLLLKEIEAGQWTPDARLPTEDELSARFRVSKVTIRQALRDLSNLGYIRREQGRGTFVQRPPLRQGPRELTSFTEEMHRHRLVATSQIRERGLVAATPDLARHLRIDPGDAVFRLRRLRLADGEPMGIQTAYLPDALVPGISDELYENASLYDVLRDRYGLSPVRARETHIAVTLGADDAAILRVQAGAPALSVQRLACLADGRPLEFVQSLMRADRYRVVLDLVSPQVAR
jgi:GntR family transcriptional regulator